VHATPDDPGAEPAGGAAGDRAVEDELDVVGAPERELVFEHEFKPLAGLGRALEDAGVGELELADREPVVVAALAILLTQRAG
jgi:hypothetical protein